MRCTPNYKTIIIIIVVITLTLIYNIYAEELPLYPEDREYALGIYEIGVENTIITDSGLEITFKNTHMGDGTVLTNGTFVIDPIYRVKMIVAQYVLVNKDKRVVRVLNIVNDKSGKNIVRFSHTYPYTPDYEYCVFHIKFDVEIIEGGSKWERAHLLINPS